MGAVWTLYKEMVTDSLEVDRLGRREGFSKLLGNNQLGDLVWNLGCGNIGAHCLERDDSTPISPFPLVASQPNSRGASESEFMKDPETPVVKGVANRYWVVTSRLVIFDILDCIKARGNEARGRHSWAYDAELD